MTERLNNFCAYTAFKVYDNFSERLEAAKIIAQNDINENLYGEYDFCNIHVLPKLTVYKGVFMCRMCRRSTYSSK